MVATLRVACQALSMGQSGHQGKVAHPKKQLIRGEWHQWKEAAWGLPPDWKWKVKVKVKVTLSCPTLCNPIDSTVHGILQARILEWVAYPFSRGSSQPRDWTQVSCLVGGFFTNWATREVQCLHFHNRNVSTSCKDICQARPSHSCSSSLCSPWRCQKNQGIRE